MKCVKTKAGEVQRVENDAAESLVRGGGATFVPKSEWKKVRGKVNYLKGDKLPK